MQRTRLRLLSGAGAIVSAWQPAVGEGESVERVRATLLGLVGFVLLAALAVGVAAGACFGVRGLWRVFLGLPKEVAVAIVAASATVFASAVAVVIGQYLQRQASIKQEIRKANAPVYEQWVSLWFHLLFAKNMGRKPLSDQEFVRRLSEFSQQLLLWGSDRAVREWVGLRLALANQEDGETEVNTSNMLLLAQFMRTIRKDMGHRNRKVGDITLLGLFINDAEEAFKKAESGGGSAHRTSTGT